jgi:hypothetical protein
MNYTKRSEYEKHLATFLVKNYAQGKVLDAELLKYAAEGAFYELKTGAPALADVEVAFDNVHTMLENVDCAGCSGPAPIYTYDIYSKLAMIDVQEEIDTCLQEYEDATGEQFTPRKGTPLSLGLLLWFAYEWRASQLASQFYGEAASLADDFQEYLNKNNVEA